MNHSRLASITYPNGRVVTYSYSAGLNDTISRLSSITDGATTLESYEYLGYGTVVKRAHPQPGVDLTYIKLSGESNGEAGDQYAGLDRFGRVVDQRWTTSGGTAKDRRKYGYDRNSNRLYAENLVDTSRSELYGYDGLNQIVSFDRGTLNASKDGITGTPSRSQDWDFDALGNWDSLTTDGGSAQTRGHNRQNEITSIAGATTPTYDANGNMTKDESGRQFKYDAFNRLVEVRDSGNNLLSTYRYDGLNRRVRETRGSTTTDLYYSSAWQVLEERVGANTKTSYVWSPVYIDAMIARDRDTNADGTLDERLYPVHDVNFNIVGLVDTTGSVVERYAYDPFGGFVILTPAWASRASTLYEWKHQFQGLMWLADAGGLDSRYRVLGVGVGRFLQNDPIGFGGRDVSWYRAFGNNPIAGLDPLGLWLLEPIGIRLLPGKIISNVTGLVASVEQVATVHLHVLNDDFDGAFVSLVAFGGGIVDDWLPGWEEPIPYLLLRPILNEIRWADPASYDRGKRAGPFAFDLATIATLLIPVKGCPLRFDARAVRSTGGQSLPRTTDLKSLPLAPEQRIPVGPRRPTPSDWPEYGRGVPYDLDFYLKYGMSMEEYAKILEGLRRFGIDGRSLNPREAKRLYDGLQ